MPKPGTEAEPMMHTFYKQIFPITVISIIAPGATLLVINIIDRYRKTREGNAKTNKR